MILIPASSSDEVVEVVVVAQHCLIMATCPLLSPSTWRTRSCDRCRSHICCLRDGSEWLLKLCSSISALCCKEQRRVASIITMAPHHRLRLELPRLLFLLCRLPQRNRHHVPNCFFRHLCIHPFSAARRQRQRPSATGTRATRREETRRALQLVMQVARMHCRPISSASSSNSILWPAWRRWEQRFSRSPSMLSPQKWRCRHR